MLDGATCLQPPVEIIVDSMLICAPLDESATLSGRCSKLASRRTSICVNLYVGMQFYIYLAWYDLRL